MINCELHMLNHIHLEPQNLRREEWQKSELPSSHAAASSGPILLKKSLLLRWEEWGPGSQGSKHYKPRKIGTQKT